MKSIAFKKVVFAGYPIRAALIPGLRETVRGPVRVSARGGAPSSWLGILLGLVANASSGCANSERGASAAVDVVQDVAETAATSLTIDDFATESIVGTADAANLRCELRAAVPTSQRLDFVFAGMFEHCARRWWALTCQTRHGFTSLPRIEEATPNQSKLDAQGNLQVVFQQSCGIRGKLQYSGFVYEFDTFYNGFALSRRPTPAEERACRDLREENRRVIAASAKTDGVLRLTENQVEWARRAIKDASLSCIQGSQGSWTLTLRGLRAVSAYGGVRALGLAIDVVHVDLDGHTARADFGTLYTVPGMLAIRGRTVDCDADVEDEYVTTVNSYAPLVGLPQVPRATVWTMRHAKVVPYGIADCSSSPVTP